VDAVRRPNRIVFSQLHTVVTASFRASKPLAVLLYGAPGSGKGTLGRLLSRVTAWPHISTGELLRQHIAAGTPAGQASVDILQGRYAPDSIVNKLVAERMAQPDCQRGVILDGYPRTIEQTGDFLPVLRHLEIEPLLVHLVLDYTEVKLRLQARRFCSSCGAIYNVVRLPPRQFGICDECGESLAERLDDQNDSIVRRIEHYAALTEPVAQLLKQKAIRNWEFSGTQTPTDILNEFLEQLQHHSLIEPKDPVAQ
jgi:adenylate kinase